jgi:hypothetical protein
MANAVDLRRVVRYLGHMFATRRITINWEYFFLYSASRSRRWSGASSISIFANPMMP